MDTVSETNVTGLGPFAVHGGNLGAARLAFPDAPEPWIDLSTGISSFPYPLPSFPQSTFAALPDPAAHAGLLAAAACAYGAPSPAQVVAAPGTQILLPMVYALVRPGRAAILSPTYAEHARAAALAGHLVAETVDAADLERADVAVIVNPNNPDGRIVPRPALDDLARTLSRHGGLLVVDEAFMDAAPEAESLADAGHGNVVVLRSFGKFYGLAGLRLGFAIAAPALAARLSETLGPWAVSGPALAVGTAALSDDAWRRRALTGLTAASQRLDACLAAHGLTVIGGTRLFRLAGSDRAQALFLALARRGILVRRFEAAPHLLRFGLPADETAWARLHDALERAA